MAARPDDRLLHCLPLHHLHGLRGRRDGVSRGGTGDRLRTGVRRGACARAAGRSAGDALFGVPAMYARLVQRRRPRLRRCACSSRARAARAGAQARVFEQRFGHAILERYGATEFGIALSQSPDEARPAGAVGRPLDGVETKISRWRARAAAPTRANCCSRASLFREYFDDEEATAKARRTAVPERRPRAARGRRELPDPRTALDRPDQGEGSSRRRARGRGGARRTSRVRRAAVVGAPDAECGEVPVAFVARARRGRSRRRRDRARGARARPLPGPQARRAGRRPARTGPARSTRRHCRRAARGE